MNEAKYAVGQRVWWKSPSNGREFLMQVRALHPYIESDCPDTYALDAVFADNCLDAPDNWANGRDMRPVTSGAPFVDVSVITEYGMTQKLSNSVRVY